MIKRTRRKFILSTMAVMALLLLLLLGAVNLVMYFSGEHQATGLMEQLARSDGALRRDEIGNPLPPQDSPSSFEPFRGAAPRNISDFSVKLGFDGTVLAVLPDAPYGLTSDEIHSLVSAALSSGASEGSLGQFRFLSAARTYGSILVFHDTQFERSVQLRLLLITGAIFLLSLAAVFPLSCGLARWAVRPVQEAFRKQRQFIADASHELRTPVTVIRANAELLESEIGENRWLSPIISESRRMQQQISDLLLLAKYDIAGQNFERQPLDLAKLVEGALLSFECLAYERGITLRSELPGALPLVGDGARLRQLCAILLDNAIKYTPSGGEISVSLLSRGHGALLTVRNTGAGIPEAEREKIFERFYRTDRSRARETGGFGLGLAIAQQIVLSHGGKISVGGREGEYTEFTVHL